MDGSFILVQCQGLWVHCGKEGVVTAGVQSVTVEVWAGCTQIARVGSKEYGPEQGLGCNPQTLNSVTNPLTPNIS